MACSPSSADEGGTFGDVSSAAVLTLVGSGDGDCGHFPPAARSFPKASRGSSLVAANAGLDTPRTNAAPADKRLRRSISTFIAVDDNSFPSFKGIGTTKALLTAPRQQSNSSSSEDLMLV